MNESIFENFKIYIYGMGEYGIDIFLRLRDIGIKVKAFIDNSHVKWSRSLYKIPCIPFKSVPIKENIIIIVGLRNSASVIEELRGVGVERIYSYQEIRNLIEDAEGVNLVNDPVVEIKEIELFRNMLMEEKLELENKLENTILSETYEEIIKQRMK